VRFAVESYFSEPRRWGDVAPGRWDQIHALSYIAIAQDALQAVRERTKLNPRLLNLDLTEWPEISTEWVADLFKKLRFAPVRQCFAAALSNSSLCSSWETATQDHPSSFPACPDVHGSVKFFVPTLKEFVSGSIMRTAAGLPKRIYSLLKIGMAEPTENFVRASRSLSNHHSRSTYSSSMAWATRALKIIGSYNVCLVEAPPTKVPGIEFH
jgi:hypothetical protein